MAKKQTFGDKMKKGKVDDRVVVKVIKGFKDESTNGTKFAEQFVKVDNLNQLDKIDINK